MSALFLGRRQAKAGLRSPQPPRFKNARLIAKQWENPHYSLSQLPTLIAWKAHVEEPPDRTPWQRQKHRASGEQKVTGPNLYVVCRCDGFYRFWVDVTEPAPIVQAKAAFDRWTSGGEHSVSPDDPEYFDICPAAPPPGWDGGFAPLIRRLRRHDEALIEAHFLAFNREDRRLRFCREIGDAQIGAYVRDLNWDHSFLLGALQDDRLIGVAEAVFDRAPAPREAEIAVTVSKPLRGRGLGRHLVDLTVDHVSARGVMRTSLFFLRENRFIQRIVRSLGGVFDAEEGAIPTRCFAPAGAGA
jgi:GNAT superfamily N-acetyltransferase